MKIKTLVSAANAKGFTLTELLVVIAMVGMLSVVCIGAMTLDNAQSRATVCADNVRQIVDASQTYANENQGLLPSVSTSGENWPWDLPVGLVQSLLNVGLKTNNFYCPGTAPKFTDWQNFENPGTGNSLWNFSPSIHVVGYTMAFGGPFSALNATNQNKTIQPEMIKINSMRPLKKAA